MTTIKLTEPVEAMGRVITELTLTDRPKARHFRTHGAKDEQEAQFQILANLCNVDFFTIEELCPEDFGKVSKAAAPLFARLAAALSDSGETLPSSPGSSALDPETLTT